MVGTREVSSQATWDRGGRILSQLGGFQVSRRGYKRKTKGNWQHCNLCPCVYGMPEMLE